MRSPVRSPPLLPAAFGLMIVFAGCLGGSSGTTPPVDAAPPQPKPPLIDLRADVNRNGGIDLDDPNEDMGEDGWSKTHGAVFLANIDDDRRVCLTKDPTARELPDDELPGCHDAVDDVINGDEDLWDLARIKTKPWPDAPDDVTGTIAVSDPGASHVRIFRKDGQGAFNPFDAGGTTFSAADLRAGVELAIEGKDILRNRDEWDGFVDLTLNVKVPSGYDGSQPTEGSDRVRLRLAPVLLHHHLSPVETGYVTRISGDPDSGRFVAGIRDAMVQSMVANPVNEIVVNDQWTEDFFETGYMSMPAPGGGQHVIHVFLRSANIDRPRTAFPLRPAGRVVFSHFRGADMAGIQHYDPTSQPRMDSLNSMGNTETIPPFSMDDGSGGMIHYPMGRLYRGSSDAFYPDRAFSKLLESQAVQPPVYVDTSWLFVGHIDETVSFLKASSPRGWFVLANDPALAKRMLEEQVAMGNGSVTMFRGKRWIDMMGVQTNAEVSIQNVLNDASIMADNAKATTEVDAQLAILKRETGITDAEIVRVPFLHEPTFGFSVAYQVGTVNFFALNDTHLIAPDPFGPVINGKDIMKDQFEKALQPYGFTVHWVDNWNLYHRLSGEVHCATNAKRQIPDVRWWEGDR